jgi:hypothetical protein
MPRIGLPRPSGVGAPSPDGKGLGPHSPTGPATPNRTGQSPRAVASVSDARAKASRKNGAKSRRPRTDQGQIGAESAQAPLRALKALWAEQATMSMAAVTPHRATPCAARQTNPSAAPSAVWNTCCRPTWARRRVTRARAAQSCIKRTRHPQQSAPIRPDGRSDEPERQVRPGSHERAASAASRRLDPPLHRCRACCRIEIDRRPHLVRPL